jgi:hypothetical protein
MVAQVAPAVPKQPATAPVTKPYDKPLAGWETTSADICERDHFTDGPGSTTGADAALAILGSVGGSRNER